MADNRKALNNILAKTYYPDTFLKRLANINNDCYTILGFYAFIVSLPDIDVNNLRDAINSPYLNNINNRVYKTSVDFINVNMKSEEFLLNLRVRDTAKDFLISRASHLVLIYETISENKPLKVTENGLVFSSPDLTPDGEYPDNYRLTEDNIACIMDWTVNEGGTSLNLLTTQVKNNEQLRIMLDLHQYRINTNILSVHIKSGDGLDHSHGLSTLTTLMKCEDELKFNNKTDFQSKLGYDNAGFMNNETNLINVGLSPLVTIEDNISEVALKSQDEVMYEDWNDSINFNYGEK